MSVSSVTLILGMHRSGTSCLAGSLEACGLHLGEVSRRGRHNAKGNRESRTVWNLHDQILGLNRGSWYDPPHSIQVHPFFADRMAELIRSLSASAAVFGFKDPRTILVLSAWKEILGERMHCVGSFRHPLRVAESLSRRDGVTIDHGLRLWLHYNSRLIKEHQVCPFPLVQYDLGDDDAYCDCVSQAAEAIGLQADRAGIEQFVSRELEHHTSGPQAVPPSCQDAYEYLQAQAVCPRSLPFNDNGQHSSGDVNAALCEFSDQRGPDCEMEAA